MVAVGVIIKDPKAALIGVALLALLLLVYYLFYFRKK
jgi:hypothetical protein